MNPLYRLEIHGARGSYAVSGTRFLRYGGYTSCFSYETPRGLIIFDAGTGLMHLGDLLAARRRLPPITLLFTHIHLDHILGLLSFKPWFRKDTHVTFMADPAQVRDCARSIRTIINPPFWPVTINQLSARLSFRDLPRLRRDGRERPAPFRLYGVPIAWTPVRHPQGGVSYRFVAGRQTVVLATDREHGDPRLDARFHAFARGADVLVHDAQYTPAEYPAKRGWGHSTWVHSVQLARELGVRQLVLTSHDPTRTDEAIERVVRQARRRFANTRAAAEGMVMDGAGRWTRAPR